MIKDPVVVGAVAVLIVILALTFFWLVPIESRRASEARRIAEDRGCEFIGRARDLGTVYFLDCGGRVEMVRVK